MSIIENEERILEAIDQLRRRKARPDADRICNYLLRRFNVDRSVTVAILNRIVLCNPAKVIKVTYKGSTSYRRPSAPKLVKTSKKYQQDFTILLSSALSELIVREPDYLDFGVPPDEFEKFIYEKEKPLYNKKSLKLIIQTEINKGTLVRLETGNLSLVDGNCSPSAIGLEERPASYDTELREKPEADPAIMSDQKESESEEETISEKKKENMPCEKGNVKGKRGKKMKTDDNISGRNTETDGFRDGARRKRAAKKMFDPSDCQQPSKRRGRPLGSKNKESTTPAPAENIPKEKDKEENVLLLEFCCVCHKHKLPTNEKLLACRDCTNRVHPSCCQRKGTGGEELWQCDHCKTCCICSETDEYASMVICYVCDAAYHFSCHTPQIPNKIRNTFICATCASNSFKRPPATVAKSQPANIHQATLPKQSPASTPSPQLPATPLPPAPPCTATSKSSGSTSDKDEDNSIPDTAAWSIKQVAKYLQERGYPDQAKVFKSNEIDGATLLMLKRSDIVGSGMFDKLGSSLRAYKQVKILQLRR